MNVLSTPSSMSNEDVEVKVLRQSGDLEHVGVPNTDPRLKEMVKFKSYAPRDELKRVAKARKML